jgi:general secretion pathway protein E
MTNALPFNFAKEHNVLLTDNKLEYSELDLAVIKEINRKFGKVELTQIDNNELQKKIQKFYESHSSRNLENYSNSDDDSLSAIAEDINKPIELLNSDDDAPIIRLLNAIFAEAILSEASDIHIESYEDRTRIRLRINGTLRQVLEPNQKMAPLIISRIKVMAKLDIAEKRVPQDGRISITLGGRAVDLRISTIPAVNGEKVVMRLLDKGVGRLELKQLGMNDATYDSIIKLIQKPHGIILVTGPTGSGKTTTLYAALGMLNNNERNIMTVEDPVEYYIDGINQTGINNKIDMTFAKGLKAILRQDPDVIMVGEIRDSETASIAVQASLTGHLVLSTLHTNSAIGAIARMQDMGVEPFLLASSLSAVLAQRLVRKLCECKEAKITDNAQMQKLGISQEQTIYHANGCEKCGYSGYSGRIGLYELVIVDEGAKSLIHNNANEQQIYDYYQGKFNSLADLAQELVLTGKTSLDEVIRVIFAK